MKSETEKFRPFLVHVYYFFLSVKVCLISSTVSENSVGRTSKCSLHSITIEENNKMDNQISTRLSMQTKQLCIVCIHCPSCRYMGVILLFRCCSTELVKVNVHSLTDWLTLQEEMHLCIRLTCQTVITCFVSFWLAWHFVCSCSIASLWSLSQHLVSIRRCFLSLTLTVILLCLGLDKA